MRSDSLACADNSMMLCYLCVGKFKDGCVLKSLIKALGLVVGLALSGIACAVSLGGINVSTALGEPLKAEISLEAADSAEASKLSVRLATPDAFKNAGVDYPYSLPLLTFQIETNPVNGEFYLKITSAQPVNEPFVNLLVELSWSSGKLLREYTFLLDPPGYVVEQPKVAEVLPVEPIVDETPAFQPLAEEVKVEPEAFSQAEPESAVPAAAENVPAEPAPVIADKPAESDDVIPDSITVKRGDTLRKLAAQVKTPDISLERMLVALYRANADAFDGKNMNRLKTGKILHVPQQAELDKLQQSEAVQEIRAQAADWHAYRQKLAAASKQVTDEKARQEVSGKISTQVEDKTPAAKESAKEVVKLSKGESPDDKTAVGSGSKSGADKARTAEEEAIARKKTIQESNERVAMLEKNIKAMQRLAELKSQMATEQSAKQTEGVAKDKSSKLGVLTKMPVPSVSDVAASSAVQPAKPVDKPKVVTAPPSIVDEILGQPLYLAGVAAALLALLGLGYVRSRRGKSVAAKQNVSDSSDGANIGAGPSASARMAALFEPVLAFMRRRRDKNDNKKEDAEDVGSISGRITAPVVPSPDTGDFTKTLVSKTAISHAPTDEVDPISEADLFLNFGRDEQAEEILKEALNKNSTNYLIHLKLLSIYANRKDVNAFSTIARQVKDSGDSAAWEQAAMMGRKLEPNNPMYGGDGNAVTVEKMPPSTTGSDTMIDVGTVKQQAAVMDFDLGAGTVKMPMTDAKAVVSDEPELDMAAAQSTPMDFDITGSHTDMTAAETGDVKSPEAQLEDLIFDVTGSHEAEQAGVKKKEPAAAAADEPEESISFLLDFPGVSNFEIEDQPVAPPQTVSIPPLDIGLGGINLNLDEPAAPTPAPASAQSGEEAHEDDIATKLDLAKAYQEMGDNDGAREILEEVVRDGDTQQRAAAEALLQALSA